MGILKEKRYRVMWVNDYGQGEINNDNINTRADAESYADELRGMFIDEDYYVESYEKTTRSYANPKSVDGWEDIYSLNEY